ncbi:RNA chaperone Hfq [Acidobacteriota bacterium]
MATEQNHQDMFLERLRKEDVIATVYLVNGIKLIGKIKNFDKFTITLVNRGQEQVIYKHAISTVTYERPV